MLQFLHYQCGIPQEPNHVREGQLQFMCLQETPDTKYHLCCYGNQNCQQNVDENGMKKAV